MAGRGRFRGGKSGPSVQMGNEGITDDQRIKNAPIEDSLVPREKYPPLKYERMPPTPVPQPGQDGYHTLLLFSNMVECASNSMYNTKLPEETDNVERYSDHMLNFNKKKNVLLLEWESMPRDLWPEEFTRYWSKKNSKLEKRKGKRELRDDLKRDDEWVSKKLRKHEEMDGTNNEGKDEVTVKEEEEDEDDDKVEEEEMEDDEEMDEDDYNQNHFDDDDDGYGGIDGEDEENHDFY